MLLCEDHESPASRTEPQEPLLPVLHSKGCIKSIFTAFGGCDAAGTFRNHLANAPLSYFGALREGLSMEQRTRHFMHPALLRHIQCYPRSTFGERLRVDTHIGARLERSRLADDIRVLPLVPVHVHTVALVLFIGQPAERLQT